MTEPDPIMEGHDPKIECFVDANSRMILRVFIGVVLVSEYSASRYRGVTGLVRLLQAAVSDLRAIADRAGSPPYRW